MYTPFCDRRRQPFTVMQPATSRESCACTAAIIAASASCASASSCAAFSAHASSLADCVVSQNSFPKPMRCSGPSRISIWLMRLGLNTQNSSQLEFATGQTRKPILQRPSQGSTPGIGLWPLTGLPGQSSPCLGQQVHPPEWAELNRIVWTPFELAAFRILVVGERTWLLSLAASCHRTRSSCGSSYVKLLHAPSRTLNLSMQPGSFSPLGSIVLRAFAPTAAALGW